MKHFDITPDVGIGSGNACATCCCMDATGVPGTIDLWRLNYAQWVVPMGGKGLSRQFSASVKLLHKSPPDPDAPVASNIEFKTMGSNAVTVQLSTMVTSADPDLTFEILPGYEPKSGSVNVTGSSLLYTPISNIVGFDYMLYRVTDSQRRTSVGEIFIEIVRAVGEEIPPRKTERKSDVVTVPRSRVNVNNQAALIDVAVQILPTANIGDIYRLTFRANALDCDANCFPHESCYDLKIGKC